MVPKFFGPLIDLRGSAADAGDAFDVVAHHDRRECSLCVKYAGKYNENEGERQTKSGSGGPHPGGRDDRV